MAKDVLIVVPEKMEFVNKGKDSYFAPLSENANQENIKIADEIKKYNNNEETSVVIIKHRVTVPKDSNLIQYVYIDLDKKPLQISEWTSAKWLSFYGSTSNSGSLWHHNTPLSKGSRKKAQEKTDEQRNGRRGNDCRKV